MEDTKERASVNFHGGFVLGEIVIEAVKAFQL